MTPLPPGSLSIRPCFCFGGRNDTGRVDQEVTEYVGLDLCEGAIFSVDHEASRQVEHRLRGSLVRMKNRRDFGTQLAPLQRIRRPVVGTSMGGDWKRWRAS